MTLPWDVVILGGGPAGCATALALQRHGIERVCLVEAGSYDSPRIGESIPPDTQVFLDEAFDLWAAFLAEQHEPCHGSCSVWGVATPGYNDFLLNPLGHGWHLDRRRFDAFLASQAAERGTTISTGWRFTAAEPLGGGGFRLSLSNTAGETNTVTARFVIDATGPLARFARERGVQRRILDRLVFAAGFFTLPDDSPLPQLTLLEATEVGWWYAARLPGKRCIVALASDADLIQARSLGRSDSWLDTLRQTTLIAPSIGTAALDADGIKRWPALSFLLESVGGPDWLAVGDAASGYDPISSQGIHKAFTDAIAAASVISQRLRTGADTTASYAEGVVHRFKDYLANRAYFYEQELRWLHAPFWRRRRERGALFYL